MPALTTAKSGKLVVFSVEMVPGTYTPILSARENSFSMSAAEIDVSSKGDGNFGASIPGDISVTSTLSGPFLDTEADNYLRGIFLSQEPISGRYITSNGDQFSGRWVLLKYDISGSKGDAETFSIDLKNYGEVVYTPAP